MNTWMELAIGIVLLIIGWLAKNLWDGLMKKIDGKVDLTIHSACIKHNDDKFNLILNEIKGMRASSDALTKTFIEKSDIVVKAVTKGQ